MPELVVKLTLLYEHLRIQIAVLDLVGFLRCERTDLNALVVQSEFLLATCSVTHSKSMLLVV